MTKEQLKLKITILEKKLEQLKEQIKELMKDDEKEKETLTKLGAISHYISEVVQAVLGAAEITLPEGKQIIVTNTGEKGLSITVGNGKATRTARGGGAKRIVFEGQPMRWAKLCQLKNIARTPGGSAHRDVYAKAKELHNSIEHECVIDGKKYPIL